ncbi:Type-1 restriction enzyme EcoKI specificity protein [compost metagenome]
MREDWKVVKLGEFAAHEKGKKPKNQKIERDDVYIYPYVNIEAFEKGIVETFTDGEKCNFCYEDDFLMVWDGSRSGLVGKGMNGALGSTLVRINFPGIENNYAYHYLSSKYQEINTRAKGSGTPHVDPYLLWNYNFPIAPLTEQRAIVAKIEELFSDLDKGIADLNLAKDQLKVYRQAVLKRAFEGELTKEWREKQTNLPTADELLERINEERKKHYEQQIEDWKKEVKDWENGKAGKKPKKPRPLDTSTIDDWDVQFKTPLHWKSCQIADVISDLTDYHANGSYLVLKENVVLSDSPDYAVMIRATNFEKDDFTDNLKYVDKHSYDFLTKSKLFGGELLIGKIGNAGRVYYMPFLNRKASLAMNLFALRIDLVSSRFIYYQLKNFHQEREIRNYVRGVGNPTIDKISIRSIHINLCSKNEQNQVIEEIESRLSVCDKVEQSITESLEKAKALRQSILKKAFEGTLLSKEEIEKCKAAPDYEPASVLLERIRKKNT